MSYRMGSDHAAAEYLAVTVGNCGQMRSKARLVALTEAGLSGNHLPER